jgi:glutamate dehydrogenase
MHQYTGEQAVYDINKIEQVLKDGQLELDLCKTDNCEKNKLRLKIYNRKSPVILSDILPILENMGLLVESERPFKILPKNTEDIIWIHDFLVKTDENIKQTKI